MVTGKRTNDDDKVVTDTLVYTMNLLEHRCMPVYEIQTVKEAVEERNENDSAKM